MHFTTDVVSLGILLPRFAKVREIVITSLGSAWAGILDRLTSRRQFVDRFTSPKLFKHLLSPVAVRVHERSAREIIITACLDNEARSPAGIKCKIPNQQRDGHLRALPVLSLRAPEGNRRPGCAAEGRTVKF